MQLWMPVSLVEKLVAPLNSMPPLKPHPEPSTHPDGPSGPAASCLDSCSPTYDDASRNTLKKIYMEVHIAH